MLALLVSGCALVLPQTGALRSQWPEGLTSHVELDDVPFFPQKDYQCGPAALATVLRYDGVAVTADDLVPQVYLPNRAGSLQIEMLAAARRHGLVSWQLAPRFPDLLREVQAGTPVIVLQDYGVWPVSYWHYAVVVGFDRDRGEVVLRSGEKRRLQVPLGVLEYTWKESAYWAMVAVAPERIPETATEAAWLPAVLAMERVAGPAAARRAYAAALHRWPDSVNSAIGLANVEYAQGDLRAAEGTLRSALAAQPQSPLLLNNLAQVLADLDRTDEALALIDRAIALGGPFTSAAQQTRAGIQRKIAGRRSETGS
jgi:hypothetical protein